MIDSTYIERWRKVNNAYSPQYVIDLIAAGAPLWIIEIEHAHFRSNSDTGANHNALFIWNRVREAHDLPQLTHTDLRRRMRDDYGWSEEYSVWNEESMDHYRKNKNFDCPAFTGTMYADGRPND